MIGPRSGRAPTAGTSRFRRLFDRGSWSVPPIVLAPALLGGVLLAVVVATSWPYFADEHAYWTAAQRFAAGQPLYDASAPVFTPYAYWYPPVLAQVLSPLTLVAPDWLFSAAWTALVVACLWYLSGRNLLVALALIAFLPVALELQARNVHLVIAALIVLALRRSWLFWIPATALKLAPVVGVLYLVAAGRRREAVLTGIFGLALTGISVVLAPQAWTDFLHVAAGRAAALDGRPAGCPLRCPPRRRSPAGNRGRVARRPGRGGRARGRDHDREPHPLGQRAEHARRGRRPPADGPGRKSCRVRPRCVRTRCGTSGHCHSRGMIVA